jgi:1,4-alpha-glucan branching enzyme
MDHIGTFSLVLHSHIPYCRRSGVWPFGEEWVFEAVVETYIPILDWLLNCHEKGVGPNVTLSFSPVLAEQLADAYMKSRIVEYMDARANAARADLMRHESVHDDRLARLSRKYVEYYENAKKRFIDYYDGDLLGAIAKLAASGRVEVLATSASHAYLPLLPQESRIRTQIRVGYEACQRHFGVLPKGAWLPECGYKPGAIERALEECGIEYFIVDTPAIAGGGPRNLYGGVPEALRRNIGAGLPSMATLMPYRLRGSKMAVFGRDEVTAAQVWSRDVGYPGDGNYLEFHKRDDSSGLRYWRVTNKLLDFGQKQLYDPEAALASARTHAQHFAGVVEERLGGYAERTGRHGIIVAPYDMELFGHWWHEGVDWLSLAMDALCASNRVECGTLGSYLKLHPPVDELELPECSWGHGGRHGVWFNSETEWMWQEIERATAIGHELEGVIGGLDGVHKIMADQALRELMLLEASDWPFLVTTGQAGGYARDRFAQHLSDFEVLAQAAMARETDLRSLEVLEASSSRDSVFTWIDWGSL